MTRSQKIFFVALGAISIVFIGSVIYGQSQDDPDCKGSQETCADDHKRVIKRMRSVFSSAGPSIELPERRYTIEAEGVRKVTVPAGPESMRTLKLRLESGQVKLTYVNTLPESDPDLRKQGTEGIDLPWRDAKDKEDENQTSFAVTKKGGTLTMLCGKQSRCLVVPE